MPSVGHVDAPAVDRCPICGATGLFERFELREMLFGLRETFVYVRCPGCGVMRIRSRPEDLSRHYPPDYYAMPAAARPSPRRGLGARADRARDERALFGTRRVEARILRRWAQALPITVRRAAPFVARAGLRSFADPILDVGCGRVPSHLIGLRELGFRRLVGIDPFLDIEGGYDGIVLQRASIHEARGTYRLVTMHHSFEHMADPVEAMISARRLLAPGGTLLVRTPVMGTWFWSTYRTNWWELDPPRHLFVHTRQSLELCARSAGLELRDVVWDSAANEIIASEQIARDIAWREPASWAESPPAGFDDATVAAFRAVVESLNGSGRAGRAGFYFRAASGEPSISAPARTTIVPIPRPAPISRPHPGRLAKRVIRASPRLTALARGLRGFVLGVPGGEARRSATSRGSANAVPLIPEIRRVSARKAAWLGPRFNLLIPSVSAASMFGGSRTALDLFEAVAPANVRRRIVVTGRWGADEDFLAGYERTMPGVDLNRDRTLVILDGDDPPTLPVGPGDIFLATFWNTADAGFSLRAWQREAFGHAPSYLGYLIQDYEPGFYGWSAQYLLARSTYAHPDETVAIFNSRLLLDYFHGEGLAFAHEFSFEPRLAPALRPHLGGIEARRQRRIVVYGRPRTPRNAFPLIVEGLRVWRKLDPRAPEWTVVSAGQEHDDIDLGGGTVLRSLGKLDLEAYGQLLATSAVGLAIMVSPHPSYPPLEMAMLGLRVVTNRFAGKDLSTWHPGISSVDDDSPDGVARAIAEACARFEDGPPRAAPTDSWFSDYASDSPQFPFAADVAQLLLPAPAVVDAGRARRGRRAARTDDGVGADPLAGGRRTSS